MKLYNLMHSPYASRVRAFIRKRGLAVEIVQPGETLRTPEFLAHFPMGKLPVLELDDGTQLPDSWVIMEYLDTLPGEGQLVPAEPLERARMQMLVRYADTYLAPGGLFPLFQKVGQGPGAEGVEQALAGLDAELARLERLLDMLPDFRQRSVHAGDLALVSAMDFVLMLCPLFGRPDVLGDYPLVRDWYAWVQQDTAVAATSEEMRSAAMAFFSR